MIKTIIFDIGNVLADFTWEQKYRSLGFTEDVLERVSKATVLSKDWDEYDRGILTDEEILSRFIQNDPEIEAAIRLSQEHFKGLVSRNDYAISWIRELKDKGFQVLYLSNFSRKAHVECADALDFMAYTDGGIMSYTVKCIKPEAQIYQLLIDKYQLIPEECVFFDDRQENLDGARKAGIRTILFQNKEQAVKELQNYI